MSENSSPTATYVQQKRLSGTKVFFITILGVIVGLFLFFFLLITFFISLAAIGSGDDGFGEPIVLELDLRAPLLDSPVAPTLFDESPASVVEIIRSLETAKTDEDVKGVFIRGETFGMAPASAEELRLALLDFRESGKFVITHAQGLNSTSIIPYHAISASDEIWLQASTSVATAGLYSQSEFLGGVFEKIDAQPEFVRHGEYKNAVNSYTETGFTDAHREATTSLLSSIFDQTVSNIATDREISEDTLLGLLDAAPHSADEALQANLVDKLGYLEEARVYAAEKAGSKGAIFKSITDYRPDGHYTAPKIALIEGQGTIMPGTSGGDGFFNASLNMGGETLAAAFDNALKEDDIEAIIFRVSSGGGSAAASDQIMAAVERAQAAEIPVIVTMGQYAASGGYYVSAPADHIIAMPQTITGSIGIFGGKVALSETFANVGYNIEAIQLGGGFAGAFNGDEPFTDAQREAYAEDISRMYEDFLGIVANGRDMGVEDVRAIAEGRVWTGQQAFERGLVDELGGFDTALQAAKRLAELDADADIQIRRFPRPKSREELFNDLFSGSASIGRDLEGLSLLMNQPEVQAALRARATITTRPHEMEAHLPEIR
ncbi:MAG: signal peptide peptidase SppA [Pseudomonadota bacterium]